MKETVSVKLDKSVVKRVRKYVSTTQQTMGGFISIEINVILDKLQPEANKLPDIKKTTQ